MKANSTKRRRIRQRRIRKKISGTPSRPRMTVFRSAKNISVQLIDDTAGKTLVCASTLEKEFRTAKDRAVCEGAKRIGQVIAERAKAQGIQNIVFDRSGYLFHGRIKALADGARTNGLKF